MNFLFTLCMLTFVCGFVYANTAKECAPAVKDTEKISFLDLKNYIEISECRIVQNSKEGLLLFVSFRNLTDETISIDAYSHTGVEMVYPQCINFVADMSTDENLCDKVSLFDEGDNECDDEVVLLELKSNRISIEPYGIYGISFQLPDSVEGLLKKGNLCYFFYTIQFWRKGNLEYDGDGDVFMFSSKISNAHFKQISL